AAWKVFSRHMWGATFTALDLGPNFQWCSPLQRDCTGVDCPVLQNCIENVLEKGACCPKCIQNGCTCEGYQYYDCVKAGFRDGKVPEGKSYFVDFGSTECSCPQGGGKISCHFIPCPEISPNCIDILQPADGCLQCGRIGCAHGNKKYEAGHSFQIDHCQVCHCPDEGGRLMCSPIPGCDRRSVNKPMSVTTTENNNPLRDFRGNRNSQQTSLAEPFSKLVRENTLPLYKQDPPSFGTEDYDYTLAEPTSSTIQNLAQPLESTTLPPAYPESSSTSLSSRDERRHRLQEESPNTQRSTEDEVTHNMDPTTTGGENKTSSPKATTATQIVTTGHHRPQQETGERPMKHGSHRNRVGQDTLRDTARTAFSFQFLPLIEFTETWKHSPVSSVVTLSGRIVAAGRPQLQSRHFCSHFSCVLFSVRTAQQQCCLGSLRESRCLAGLNAARAGNMCREDASCLCELQECCTCCSLGLQFRSEGHRCEAHHYLDFHCKHIFLTCCEGEEGRTVNQDAFRRPLSALRSSCHLLSDSPYRREAFSIGQEQNGENAVESPVEVEDMDECLIYEGNICHHICVNTIGSFRCECNPGYVLQEDTFSCVQGNNICEQQCTPVGGQPRCSCSPGFSLRADGRSCEDTNECLSPHACQLNEHCMNTAGSYVCQRLITCPPGYQINNDICEDINECAQRTHNCGDGFECVNTEGSFRCNPKTRCPVGFSHNMQGRCVDVDECGALTQPCSPGFNCVNTMGSYICNRKITCSRGYHASPDGSRCVDVDECQSNVHRCGEGQLCHNLPGSYRCECRTGYQYDSFRRMCVDINECWSYRGRLCAQTCENTPGSYECSCTSGFRLSGDGKNCEDVNECLANLCSQECANVYGSYQCYCRQGYYLKEDGHTCEDIDECSQSIGHLCTYKCVNIPGSYKCACPDYGYTMSPNGRSCRDIDECATGANNCSLAETCYNIQGGYRCLSFSCSANYRRVSDTRCERISCPNYLECQNSPLRITYYYLSFQSNIIIPAQIFRIGPSPAYSGDNIIVSITSGNEENYFSTRKLNAYTGAVFLNRQVQGPRDFLINVEMKLWRQGTFTTFHARIYVFITGNLL
uniref:Fibulin 2 n=1 Tax=Neolamprologus brichardi TaxID=32507 RepID=A0A3Q4N7G8_NEOBR